MTPYRIGWIAALAAAAMILVQIAGYRWFVIRITDGFSFPLWILVAVYAGLQFWSWRLTKERLALSDDEVARWGDKLEQATPKILRLYEDGRPVGEIAREIETSHGIPQDVTLRYIIALAQFATPGAPASPSGGPVPPPDDSSTPEAS